MRGVVMYAPGDVRIEDRHSTRKDPNGHVVSR
jgi:hypothetical protein